MSSYVIQNDGGMFLTDGDECVAWAGDVEAACVYPTEAEALADMGLVRRYGCDVPMTVVAMRVEMVRI